MAFVSFSKFHTSDNSPPQTKHSNQQSLTTFHSLNIGSGGAAVDDKDVPWDFALGTSP